MKINRKVLVMRHAVNITRTNPLYRQWRTYLAVDVTGLQLFTGFHQDGIPLCTQSQCGLKCQTPKAKAQFTKWKFIKPVTSQLLTYKI